MKNEKKILFIDPLSPKGHLNFNSIYIKYLYEHCHNIDFAFKVDYDKHFKLKTNAVIYQIPKKFYEKTNNKILSRFYLLRIFRYIKENCNLDQYDFVLMSSFEEISLYMASYTTPVFLVHHNNFRSIDNPFKLYFYKKVANKNCNIVFEHYMKKMLDSLGVERTFVVRHGLQKPIDEKILDNNNLRIKFKNINKYDHVIFSPSASSADNDFITKLLSNNDFISCLESNNILLILKGDFKIKHQHRNISIIKRYLTDIEYNYLFLRSSAILISYPLSHIYRVSAVLFECISNNKLCLVSKIDSLLVYKEYFKYDPYFGSKEELIKKIGSIIEFLSSGETNMYKNQLDLQPNFKEVLNLDSNKAGCID